MTQVPPSPVILIENEKTPNLNANETGINEILEQKDDISSADGDDALILTGNQAHYFDEKYNARLLRKIVSRYEKKNNNLDNITDLLSIGPSRHSASRFRLFHPVLG
jgi:hypothetical protein